MVFDDAISDRKPETNTNPDSFCRKPRLEHVGKDIGRDARSVVLDRDQETAIFGARLDLDAAPIGDRLPRIDQHIEEDLVELSRFTDDRRNRSIEVANDFDLGPELVANQRKGVFDTLVDVELLELCLIE